MANKTKKRLVTGIACAVPAVIALPSLLALTQCGSSSGTEHVELSGDTKKEESKSILNETFTYEFLLKNVDNPTTIQVSLPKLSVNGKEASEGEKLQVYKASVSANSVVTITFYRDQIMKIADATNDATTPYEVKFDVNLKNDQINETLTGFKLDVVMPTFASIKKLEHATVKEESTDKPEFYWDYTITIEADDNYDFDKHEAEGNFSILCDGKAMAADEYKVEWSKTEDKTKSVTITVYGEYIKGDLTFVVKATANEWKIDTTDVDAYIKPDKAIGTPTYGQTIDTTISWVKTGYTLDGTGKVLVEKDGAYTEVEGSAFDDEHIYIPGDKITGNLMLTGKFTERKVYAYTTEFTWVKFDGFDDTGKYTKEIPYKSDVKFTFTVNEFAHKLIDHRVFIGSTILETSEYKINPLGFTEEGKFRGEVEIAGKHVTDDITLSRFETRKIETKVTVEGDDNLTFAAYEAEWGTLLDLKFAQHTEGQPSKIERGYQLDTLYATRTVLGYPQETITDKLVKVEASSNPNEERKAERYTGLQLPAKEMMTADDAEFYIKATTKACERAVELPTADHFTIGTPSVTKPTIQTGYEIEFTPQLGYGFGSLEVYQDDFDDTKHAYSLKLVEGTDYTLEPSVSAGSEDAFTLKIKPASILGDLKIKFSVSAVKRTVEATTEHCDWDNYPGWTKTEAYVDKDYDCKFILKDGYEFKTNYKPTVGIWDPKQEKYIELDPTTEGFTFTLISGTKNEYQLHLKAGLVTGNVQIECKATAIERKVTWKQWHQSAKLEGEIIDTYKGTITGGAPSIENPLEATIDTSDFPGYEIDKTVKPSVFIGTNRLDDNKVSFESATGEHPQTATLHVDAQWITDDVTVDYGGICSQYKCEVKSGTETAHFTYVIDTGVTGKSTVDVEHNLRVSITADDYYEVKNKPTVTIGDNPYELTGDEWTITNGVGLIALDSTKLLGDVEITFSATPAEVETYVKYDKTKTKAKASSEPSIENDFVVEFEPQDYYEITKTNLYVSIGGSEYTSYNWEPNAEKTYAKLTIPCKDIKGFIYVEYDATPISRNFNCNEKDPTSTDKTVTFSPESGECSIQQGISVTVTPRTGYFLPDADTKKPNITVNGQAVGYTGIKWEVNDAGTSGTLTIDKSVVKGDVGIYYSADPVERKVTITANNCSPSTASVDIKYDQEFTYTFTPAEHYEITTATFKPKWTLNGTSEDFIPDKYLSVVDGKGIVKVPAKTIYENTSITFTATAKTYTIHMEGVQCTPSSGTAECKYDEESADLVYTISDQTYKRWTLTGLTQGNGLDIRYGSKEGQVVPSSAYTWTPSTGASGDSAKLKFNAKAVSSDIYVTVTAKAKDYNVHVNGTECTMTDKTATAEEGCVCDIVATQYYGFKQATSTFKVTSYDDDDVEIESYNPTYGTDWNVTYDATGTIATAHLTIPASRIKGKIVVDAVATANTYEVKHTETNCTFASTQETTATYKKDYICTFTAPNSDYTITPTVTIGIKSFTSYQWDQPAEIGTLTIPGASITGEIVINAVAKANTHDVYKDVKEADNHVTISGSDKASQADDYTCTLTASNNYQFKKDVTEDGIKYKVGASGTYAVVESGWVNYVSNTTATLTIPKAKILDNLYITATATAITRTVKFSGTKCSKTSTENPDVTKAFNMTITAETNYHFNNSSMPTGFTATMGGNDITSTDHVKYYDDHITIDYAAGELTGNIEVNAIAYAKTFSVQFNVGETGYNCSETHNPTSPTYGQDLVVTIIASPGFYFDSTNDQFYLEIGSTDVTATAKSEKWIDYGTAAKPTPITLTIPGAQVTGIIVIKIFATQDTSL